MKALLRSIKTPSVIKKKKKEEEILQTIRGSLRSSHFTTSPEAVFTHISRGRDVISEEDGVLTLI